MWIALYGWIWRRVIWYKDTDVSDDNLPTHSVEDWRSWFLRNVGNYVPKISGSQTRILYPSHLRGTADYPTRVERKEPNLHLKPRNEIYLSAFTSPSTFKMFHLRMFLSDLSLTAAPFCNKWLNICQGYPKVHSTPSITRLDMMPTRVPAALTTSIPRSLRS